MTAEKIANVVAELRAGHLQSAELRTHRAGEALARAQQPQPVVDATALASAVYDNLTVDSLLCNKYSSIALPWNDALVCFIGSEDIVWALQVHSMPYEPKHQWNDGDYPVDWSRVRWLIQAFGWASLPVDGGGHGLPLGPVGLLEYAVCADGTCAGVGMAKYTGSDSGFEQELAVLGAVLNFLNCSNVELAEPQRPRAQRRRLARSGVTVQEIVVRQLGHRSRSTAGSRPMDAYDTPLTSVRGHFAHYGPQYNRGKLFGKYDGKFWIPGYAKGTGDGAVQKDYVLKPARA